MDAVIIGGGSLHRQAFTTFFNRNKRDSLYVIAADHGLDHCTEMGIRPDLIIGDFDSASDQMKAAVDRLSSEDSGIEIIRLNPIKDDTDMEAALRQAQKRTDGDITILCGTGTRLDHVIANIRLMGLMFDDDSAGSASSLRLMRHAYLIDDTNRIQLIKGPGKLTIGRTSQYGKYVSVIPLTTDVEGLTMEGFFYPLKDAHISGYSSLTISNEITEDQAVIAVRAGAAAVLETKDRAYI